MYRIFSVILILILAGCNATGDSSTTTSAGAAGVQVPASTETTPQPAHVHAWKPVAFAATATKLQPNSKGIFFKKFEAKIEESAKGEYETTEHYKNRIANTDALVKPFSTEVEYAFVPQYAALIYDADKQEYGSPFSGVSCYEGYPIKEGISCQIGSVTNKTDNYRGQNAFGATADVTSESGKDLYFVFPPSELSNRQFKDPTFGYRLPLRCPVKLKEAKKYKGMHVMAAIVIKLRKPTVLSGHMRIQDATIASPHREIFYSVGIPAFFEKSLCFVQETGEILHVTSYK